MVENEYMSKFEDKLLAMIMSGLLAVALFAVAGEVRAYKAIRNASSEQTQEVFLGHPAQDDDVVCVVIDAGHGGSDPGKIGINNALEKDVNLSIALLVKQFLEANDIKVVLTREDEEGLYDADASNKKVQDMKRRVTIIEEATPDVTVSIHQNSYPEEYVHGAQVFYYTTSTEGKALAEIIQNRLIKDVDPENTRQVKANDSYYLLKKTGSPIVIVECGFLSNQQEAEKLCTPYYQEKLAWAIHLGILQYLNGR